MMYCKEISSVCLKTEESRAKLAENKGICFYICNISWQISQVKKWLTEKTGKLHLFKIFLYSPTSQ